MPNDWFLALEQPNSRELFLANDYMSRFRFVPDTNPVKNESLMPVGFSIDDPDPVTKTRNLGLSCALCHTSMVTYKGTTLRIDGAPGTFNFDTFLEQLILAVGLTVAPEPLQSVYAPGKFDRFAHRILSSRYSESSAEELRGQVRSWLSEKIGERWDQLWTEIKSGTYSTKNGFGRLDALGTGGNTVYRKLGVQNLRGLTGPVKAYPLWYASDYDWVQSNGSVRQPMSRNIIEALAVNAYLALPGQSQQARYESSVRMKQMWEMESAMSRLEAPKWPIDLFGAVNSAKVERGKVLYGQLCASCHAPKIEPMPLCGDDVAIRNNKRYFMLRLFLADRIGTDPVDAVNFATRTLDATQLGLKKDTPGAAVIQMVVGGVLRRGFQQYNLTPAEKDEWVGYRADCWRAVQGYPARPLDGIWAASPYLHNASVPNLYELLLPAEKRSKVFYTGSTEFDPVRVGYETRPIQGSFKFDVTERGNSNQGHEFRNAPANTKGVIGPELTDSQRWDLIEYLKVVSEMPEAKRAAAEEPISNYAGRCWKDPYWGICLAAPLDATPGSTPESTRR